MARINTEQLRNWQNGDVIPASDYNQERNLIITANNDTNDKANTATQNAENALDRVSRLEIQPTNIEETSIISRQTISLTEGQTIVSIPEPGYLPNTNRIQVFIDGQLTQVEETSSTSVTLQSPAIADQQCTAVWYTELPRVFDLTRIEDAIDNARTNWLEPVGVAGQLPYPAQEGDHCAVTSEEKVYRFQNGTWVYIMDAPNILDSGVPKVTQISRVHTATADQQTFAMPTNYDTATDSAFVIRNTTFVPPSKYSLTSTTLTLATPAKEGDEIIIIGYKAMPMGTDGSVSGLVIQPGTMPVDRIIGGDNILSDIQNNANQIGALSGLNTTAKDNLVNAVNELFTNVSNGKTQIATAITDKGVAASGGDTFPQLATKISQIETGNYSIGDSISYKSLGLEKPFTKWLFSDPNISTPYNASVNDNQLCFRIANYEVACVNVNTGVQLWRTTNAYGTGIETIQLSTDNSVNRTWVSNDSYLYYYSSTGYLQYVDNISSPTVLAIHPVTYNLCYTLSNDSKLRYYSGTTKVSEVQAGGYTYAGGPTKNFFVDTPDNVFFYIDSATGQLRKRQLSTGNAISYITPSDSSFIFTCDDQFNFIYVLSGLDLIKYDYNFNQIWKVAVTVTSTTSRGNIKLDKDKNISMNIYENGEWYFKTYSPSGVLLDSFKSGSLTTINHSGSVIIAPLGYITGLERSRTINS